MKWFILLVGVVVLCFTLALVFGLIGGGMSRGTSSLSHEPLPDDALTDADFDELHFDVGLRGYRMSEVDGVIDRLRRELREKDEQIGVLRGPSRPPADGVRSETDAATSLSAATERSGVDSPPDENVDTDELDAGRGETRQTDTVTPGTDKPATVQTEQPQHSEPHG